MSILRRIPLYVRILIGMALGVVVGLALGPNAVRLGEFGALVIRMIKTLAAPLLFFAIVDAFLKASIRLRQAGWMVLISAINAMIALVIGLSISNLMRPGDHMVDTVAAIHAAAPGAASAMPAAAKAPEKLDFVKAITEHVPKSVAEPFVQNAIISIIILAVIAGVALRRVREERRAAGLPGGELIDQGVAICYRALEIALTWIIALIPLAVFGVVAQTIGRDGFKAIGGLGYYFFAVLLGLSLHVFVVYQGWLLVFSPMSLRRFWAGGRDAFVYSLGAASSLATLPLTLKCLDNMGVSKRSSRLAACVGTNLNNDSILLYEALAVLFVAQAHGIQLSIGQQVVVALSSAIAGVGIAGVPEAGFISLSIVLVTVGLPTELLPLMLTVDWILSRARAVTNVVADMVCATVLDRLAGPGDEDDGEPEPACEAASRSETAGQKMGV